MANDELEQAMNFVLRQRLGVLAPFEGLIWEAHPEGRPGMREAGRTQAEALGKLIITLATTEGSGVNVREEQKGHTDGRSIR